MLTLMRAVRLVEIGHPLQLQALPLPTLGPQDVLVRVHAAGICHSDVHYRAGLSPAGPLPLTLGHEVAGTVASVGALVQAFQPGDRVCVHYMLSCGHCEYCDRGAEQFCPSGKMVGKHRDGGYAEFIAVPERSVFLLPAEIPFEQGAVMMCSSATAFHALRKARLQPGERLAVFGAGGLGMSAIQLGKAFGALEVYAVDLDPGRLAMARVLGAVPVDAKAIDAAAEIRRLSGGRGVDVALDLVGLPATFRPALAAVAAFGRVVAVGLGDQDVPIHPYQEIINREAEIIGCSDHLASEIPLLTELVRRRVLDLAPVVTERIPLEPAAINAVMNRLEQYGAGGVRTVIVM